MFSHVELSDVKLLLYYVSVKHRLSWYTTVGIFGFSIILKLVWWCSYHAWPPFCRGYSTSESAMMPVIPTYERPLLFQPKTLAGVRAHHSAFDSSSVELNMLFTCRRGGACYYLSAWSASLRCLLP